MAKKKAEGKIVFSIFLLIELLIIALVIMKGDTDLNVEGWKLWTVSGGFLVIYIFYLKFRTQAVQQHVVDEKVKTQVLIGGLPYGVIVLDDAGDVVSLNQKAAMAAEVDLIDVIGKSLESQSSVDGEFAEKLLQKRYGQFGPWKNRTVTLTALGKEDGMLVLFSEELSAGTASRSSFGQMDLSADMDLATVCGDALESMKSEAAACGQSLEYINETNGSCPMKGDATHLQWAYREMLRNALAQSEQGKTVTLTIDAGSDDYQVKIRDYGAGIREDHIANLFDQGYTVDREGEQSGSGLGLYFVKYIIDLHGGSIWAESREQEGTLISLNLPH